MAKNNNTAATLPNDLTPGTDDTDYDVWRTHFGQTSGTYPARAVDSASVAVPEASSLLLMALAAPLLFLRGRRLDSIHTAYCSQE